MRKKKRGVTLLLVAVTLPVMVAMLGLAADLGHVYIVKSELQGYVDAAALAACRELDGTAQGVARAQAVAAAGPGAGAATNKWDFSTKVVAGVQTSFSQTFNGTYVANPGSGSGYRFVRVSASVQIPLFFLPVLRGIGTTQTVTANAIGGQATKTSMGDGLAPFSPDAHDAADPNFGFVKGQQYTLKWPPPGQRGKPGNQCNGDVGFTPGGGSSDRGYIDVGQGNGNSALHDAVVNNDFQLAEPLTVGSPIDTVPGNKHVGPAVEERYNQDTDTAAATYSAYNGNGRRILIAAVNDRGDPARVAGFGAFFLPPDACGNKNTSPCCAEYIGPALVSGTRSAAGLGGGLYKPVLFR